MFNTEMVSFSMIKEVLKDKKVRPLFLKCLSVALVNIGIACSLIVLYPPAVLFIIFGSIMTLFAALAIVAFLL